MSVRSLLPLLLALLVAGLLVVATRHRTGSRLRAPSAQLRHLWTYRAAGATIGVGVALVLASSPANDLGLGIMLAVPAFALCVLAGVLLGELTLSRALTDKRAAVMEVRRVTDYLPRRLTTVVGAMAGVLLGLLAVTTLVASPDDMGRAGRAISAACSVESSSTAGPWPGSYYSVPAVLMLLAGIGLTVFTLRRITARGRAGADASTLSADDALRRHAGSAGVGALGLLIAVLLAGTALISAAALNTLGLNCAGVTAVRPLALLLALVGLAAFVAVVPCLAALIAPRHEPETSAEVQA